MVSHFGRGGSPILPLKIKCTIDDDVFSGCSKTEFDSSQCPHVAGVNCQGQYIQLPYSERLQVTNSLSSFHLQLTVLQMAGQTAVNVKTVLTVLLFWMSSPSYVAVIQIVTRLVNAVLIYPLWRTAEVS